jgi:hypothetical protein
MGGEFGVRELIQSAMTEHSVVSIWFRASGGIWFAPTRFMR